MKKAMTPQQRARNKKRAKGWVPYEAWVHHTNYNKLVAAVKAWQTPAIDDSEHTPSGMPEKPN